MELTSPNFGNSYPWQPLLPEIRKWETTNSKDSGEPLPEENEMKAGSLLSGGRPHPKKIKDEHFWGVREDWGPRAGRWGKGAAVFDKKK